MKRILSIILCLAIVVSFATVAINANAVTTDKNNSGADVSVSPSSASLSSPSDFTWDNASVYFLLTDRFKNGNTSNDHSYKRGLNLKGEPVKGNSDAAMFHGGDFAGITQAINDGYFENLGVNALWISAPYEQSHGWVAAGAGVNGTFAHYSYHGYYVLDYTQTDKNFGTEEEFATLVETAHSHGLRVVLDIVMNHAGYCTLDDMHNYGYGVIKRADWRTQYYNQTMSSGDLNAYIDYENDANAWGKWWGSDWLRAGIAGYKLDNSSDYTKQLTYLPDFKTESSTTVDIPELMKTKWTKDGILAQRTSETNQYFSSTGKQKTVRNFLVYWLSQWVEKYGIDGFRCDTAKHVELASWNALKTACSESLKKWRANNPTAPGADWDEDFWMTGECFPHYLSYDNYYTQGGFDSMINFSYQSGGGVPGASSINSTYNDYANQLNNNDKFNVLTFISSHDCPTYNRSDAIYQGSAFQLLPGAIQIFYGDETARPNATANVKLEDHAMRSDMNWGQNQSILQHWQKVGQFRNNHVAVGAGSHKTLSATSGAAFARSYNKNGVADVVAACIGANKNTSVTITLNNTFPDGTVLKNTYDGTTAAVSGGKVTFNSGANGTILLETSDGSTPVIPDTTAPTKPQPTQSSTEVIGIYGDANVDGKIDINDVTLIQKSLVELAEISPKGFTLADVDKDDTIKIKDASYIQKYILGMSNVANVGTKLIKNNPVDSTNPPITQPAEDGTVVYFENTNNWSNVYIYYWQQGGDGPNKWPGTPMEQTSDGKWKYTIPTGMNKVIFNDGKENGAQQTGDLDVPTSSGMTFNYSSNSWS